MAETGASTSAYVDRYYFSLLNVRYSFRARDIAGVTATARKATEDAADTKDMKAALERARIACQAS